MALACQKPKELRYPPSVAQNRPQADRSADDDPSDEGGATTSQQPTTELRLWSTPVAPMRAPRCVGSAATVISVSAAGRNSRVHPDGDGPVAKGVCP